MYDSIALSPFTPAPSRILSSYNSLSLSPPPAPTTVPFSADLTTLKTSLLLPFDWHIFLMTFVLPLYFSSKKFLFLQKKLLSKARVSGHLLPMVCVGVKSYCCWVARTCPDFCLRSERDPSWVWVWRILGEAWVSINIGVSTVLRKRQSGSMVYSYRKKSLKKIMFLL